MGLAGWLATSPASIGEHEEDERGLRSPGNSSPALYRTPHCRALSHRGTMPELRGSRLGERNYLRKMDAAHGTRHPHTHTQCEPSYRAEGIRHFPR